MSKNKLIVAAAGSGKTTRLVRDALKIAGENIVITTFTESNEAEIERKFFEEHGSVPGNVTIQTWFSFLLEHGVRPYQGGIFDERVTGLTLVPGQSATGTKEIDIALHYFDVIQHRMCTPCQHP
jgi:DNA helicase-2/ATP-dependent DNA helicase PcrA